MCGGGGTKVVQQDPDPGALFAQEFALNDYKKQMEEQQQLFQQQLNAQIAAANERTQALKIQLEQERAQLEADQAAAFEGAYNVESAKVTQGQGAQSTKKQPKAAKDTGRKGLKINVAGVQNTSGTGINLGV